LARAPAGMCTNLQPVRSRPARSDFSKSGHSRSVRTHAGLLRFPPIAAVPLHRSERRDVTLAVLTPLGREVGHTCVAEISQHVGRARRSWPPNVQRTAAVKARYLTAVRARYLCARGPMSFVRCSPSLVLLAVSAMPVISRCMGSSHPIDAAPEGCTSRHVNPRYLASVLIEWSRGSHSVAPAHRFERKAPLSSSLSPERSSKSRSSSAITPRSWSAPLSRSQAH
jgi:hypothetical protein